MLRQLLLSAAFAAAVPGADGPVAFVAHDPSGSAGIDVIAPDGSGRHRLLSEFGAYTPAYSPDGGWVAYIGGSTTPELRVSNGARVVRIDIGSLRPGAPAWGGLTDGSIGRLAYVATGQSAPGNPGFDSRVWSTEIAGPTAPQDLYRAARWAYDQPVFAAVEQPADPAIAPDGSALVVAAHHDGQGRGADIAILRDWRRVNRDGRQEIHADAVWLTSGPGYSAQPSWEARVNPLPEGADGDFDRRTRVTARFRGGRVTLRNRNRFVVTARVKRRTVRLRPATRRRATVRRVRVGGRVRRTRISDTAGHRRVIRVRSLRT
jgi:hypothetical protein